MKMIAYQCIYESQEISKDPQELQIAILELLKNP